MPKPVEESPLSLYSVMLYLIKLAAIAIAIIVPIYEAKHYVTLTMVFLIAHFESKKNK